MEENKSPSKSCPIARSSGKRFDQCLKSECAWWNGDECLVVDVGYAVLHSTELLDIAMIRWHHMLGQ